MTTEQAASGYVSQGEMWEDAHKARDGEFCQLSDHPTRFAEVCANYLSPESLILELGCANGRDARYFIEKKNSRVIGLDISSAALNQFQRHQADILENTFLIQASAPNLPFNGHLKIDAFYARSAIYMDDDYLLEMLYRIKAILKNGGYVMIQGKTAESEDIQQSRPISKNLMQDPKGHIRRLWTEEGIRKIFSQVGLVIIEIGQTEEYLQDRRIKFIHVIARKK